MTKNRYSLYADVLEMQDNIIFEYDGDLDEVCFYVIVNGREVLARKIPDFINWKTQYTPERVEKEGIGPIVDMWEKIIAGEPIDTAVSTSYFHENKDESDVYRVLGRKHVDIDGNESYVGVLSTTNPEMIKLYKKQFGVDFEKDSGVDVYNKRSILDLARSLISSNPEKRFYIAIFDVDNFKNINDGFGHFFGDDVLVKVSEVIKTAVKDVGTVGRVGGDEFFVVFDKISDRDEMKSVLKDAREKVEAEFKGKTGDFSITCSAGACAYPECGSTLEDLYKVADALLYLAKEKGRNRYILYRDDFHKELMTRVLNADSEGKVADIYDDVSVFWNHTNLMNSIISKFLLEGTTSNEEVFETIENRFFVDYIQIANTKKNYYFERISTVPNENPDKDNFLVMNEEMMAEFKGLNFFMANNVLTFRNSDSSGRAFMVKNKINTALFYRIKEDGEDVGYIMFGKVRDTRKWAEQDGIVLTTIAQILSYKN